MAARPHMRTLSSKARQLPGDVTGRITRRASPDAPASRRASFASPEPDESLIRPAIGTRIEDLEGSKRADIAGNTDQPIGSQRSGHSLAETSVSA